MSDPKVSASEAEEARSEAREPLGAQQAVMIFVKRPAPGRVKTRLAAGVGADAACDFYRACCEHVVTNIARCPDLYVTIASRCCGVAGRHASTHVFIFFSEPSDEGEIRRWMQQLLPSSTSLRFVPQVGGDVGARMQAAFQHVLGLGYQRVVVIGTDIPDVDGVTVAAALSALRNHQVVFGPALDGGYYLLGLTAVLPCLFHHVLIPYMHVLIPYMHVLIPYMHVLILYMHVLIPYMHVLIPYMHVLIPYLHVLIPYMHVLIPYMHVLIPYMHVLIPYMHVLIPYMHVLIPYLHVLIPYMYAYAYQYPISHLHPS
ncbi:unnamed protein product [Closterium sp. NIES-65]|nr:unnamed protein product [Closterium sp. NIES-65]CAI5990384.1 unnamed protein product [Closterium sp. NIES-65]